MPFKLLRITRSSNIAYFLYEAPAARMESRVCNDDFSKGSVQSTLTSVGSEGSEFIGLHGAKDASGPDNPDDAFLNYDFASGDYISMVDGGAACVGQFDTVIVGGNDTGATYEFDIASVPEPASSAVAAEGMALFLPGALAQRGKATS